MLLPQTGDVTLVILTGEICVDGSKDSSLLGRRKTHDVGVVFFFRDHDHHTGTCRHTQCS